MSKLQELADLEVVDRGPDWLFVRMHSQLDHMDDVADRLWELMNKHFIHRMVLEMDEVLYFPSLLIGQLVMLQKRVMQDGGALRLCGLTPDCADALHICRLDQALPHFETRADAVRGFSNAKPR